MTPANPPLLSELHGKSLLLFDDGLASKDGHWFEIDKAIVGLHAQAGAVIAVVSGSTFAFADELAEAGATVLPRIEHSLWSGRMAGGSGLWHEFKGTVELAQHFRDILVPILRERTFDCVLHPSAMLADLLAWAMVPRKLRRQVGRVALLTRFGVGAYSATQPPAFARKLAVWRWLVGWLGPEFKTGRFVLLTDSGRLADEYAAIAGVRPAVVCSPRAIAPLATPAERQPWLTFGTLGAARIDKGIHLLQAAIERLASDGTIGDVRFVIQWNRPVPNDDGSDYPRSPQLVANPQVRYIEEALSSAEYDRMFLGIDCMVLPYRRALYHSQISGVAVEAACAGIPMIYTADTWMSDFVEEQGAGIAVADGDVDGLAQAILAMAADYPAYKALAVERSAIARKRNSPAEFARVLWGAGPNLRADRKAA